MQLEYSELDNDVLLTKLIGTGESVVRRGGRMVQIKPNSDVQNVLKITGFPAVIPVYSHLEPAETMLLAT